MNDEAYPTWRRSLLTAARIITVLAFIAAGTAKLLGAPMMVTVFEHVGLGQWFRYVTGAIEVTGAIMLVTPRLVGVGGLLLATTMVGAIISHLTVVPGSPAPAALLLVLSATIAWNYRGRTAALLSGVAAPQAVA